MTGPKLKSMARLSLFGLVCAGFYATPSVATAQSQHTTSVPASSLEVRIEQLVPVLKGDMPLDQYFDPAFLTAVPAETFKKLSSDISKQFGQPLRTGQITRKGANAASVEVMYEQGVGIFDIYVSGVGDSKVTGLLTKGFTATGDSIAKIDAEFAALSGHAGYVVQTLNDNDNAITIAARAENRQFAIGSTFKLYILAELASEIEDGVRHWTDVEPLSQRSFSSSATNNWPKDSPATLHSLATWMISVSDNSATDTLLHILGRSNVEQKLALVGHKDPDKALPFLSTVEAFALKSPANKSVRDRFLKANEAHQRELLENETAHLGYDNVDPSAFSGGPAFIDTLEWFAAPTDIVRIMDNIRRTGNQGALDILAVNSGVSDASKKRWRYLGYKGGSEPGVISMSYLGQSPSGKWIVVTGSWNDASAAVDEAKFSNLMSRLLDQAASE